MKKIALSLMTIGLLLAFYPYQSKAATVVTPSSSVVSKPADSEKTKVLLNRLNEIKAMDKSNLKAQEKKNLRKEVLTIKHELKEAGGYIYISGLGLLLIILLIILL